MASSPEALLKRVDHMIIAVKLKSYPPMHHTFCIEAGQELTAEQRAQVGPYDTVVIREYPKGLFSRV